MIIRFLEIDKRRENIHKEFLLHKASSQKEHEILLLVQQTSMLQYNASTNRIGKRTSIFISFFVAFVTSRMCITLIHVQFIYSFVLQYWSNKKRR